MDYNARFYRPYLKHFLMPDSIVPGISSQALNRYMYVMGNPINYNDPSGYLPCEGANGCKGGKSRIPELEKYSDIEDYLFIYLFIYLFNIQFL